MYGELKILLRIFPTVTRLWDFPRLRRSRRRAFWKFMTEKSQRNLFSKFGVVQGISSDYLQNNLKYR